MADSSTNSTAENIANDEMTDIQNGGADAMVAMQGNTGLAIQTACNKCEKSNDNKATNKEITCKFCEQWTCHKCADLKPQQIELFDRGNLYFACDNCQDAVSKIAAEMRSNRGLISTTAAKSNAVSESGPFNVDKQLVDLKGELEQRFSDLEKLIKQTQGH